MNLSTVLQRIPFWYAGAIDESMSDRIRCYYLKSQPGRGKTSTLKQAPRIIKQRLNMSVGLIILNAPLMTPADGVGYLIPRKMPDGRAESLFTDPFFYRTDEGKRLEEYEGGVIIVDEMDKADVDLKKVIGEAALSGRLGPHRLPRNWVVWMAGNRNQDRSGSTKELDHLINRRCEIEITDDIVSWTEWAEANGVSHITIAFANNNINVVFTEKVPEKQGPWCTPRSLCMWDSQMQTIQRMTGQFPDDPAAVEEAGGIIGDAAAAQYFSWVRMDREAPTFEQIVANPKSTRVPDKIDMQMLICYNLAHRVTGETIGPVIQYVERLPKEFSVTFTTSACRRQPLLVMTPAMKKWIGENASLMAAIAR